MGMVRRTIASGTVVGVMLVGSALGSTAIASAAGSSTYHIDYTVNATTTLAKLHQTVTVPPGSFIGSINLKTFALTGNLNLPPASTTVSLAGIGLATATFKLSQTKPVTGTVDLKTLEVTATATVNVLVTSVKPLGLPINLVGNSCGTSTPVSVTFSGKISLKGTSAFSGTYTIPPLQSCGLTTPALNLVIPGPGNVFSATFSPAT